MNHQKQFERLKFSFATKIQIRKKEQQENYFCAWINNDAVNERLPKQKKNKHEITKENRELCWLEPKITRFCNQNVGIVQLNSEQTRNGTTDPSTRNICKEKFASEQCTKKRQSQQSARMLSIANSNNTQQC